MAMLSVYSVLSGYDYTNAVVLAVFATIGAIVLQAGVLGLQTRRPIPLAAVRHRLDFPAGAPAGNHEREAGCLWRRVRTRGLLEGLYTIGLISIVKSYRGVGISTADGYFVSMGGLGELTGALATG